MKNKQFIQKNMSVKKPIKQKKTWSYWVVVIALAFMFVSSFLGTYAFIKTVSAEETPYILLELEDNSNSVNLFSDTVEESYSFTSSNIVLPVSKYVYDSTSGYTVISTSNPTFMNFSFYFEKINGQYNISCLVADLNSPNIVYNNLDYAVLMRYKQPFGSTYYVPYIRLGGDPNFTLSTHTFNINGNSITAQKFNNLYIQPYLPLNDGGGLTQFQPYTGLTNFTYGADRLSNYHFFMNFQCDPLFNFNVVSITMGSMQMGWYNGYGFNIFANYVSYNDINGKQFTVYFPFGYVNANDYYAYALQPRTYYLSTNLNDDIIYKQGYDNGYNDSLNEWSDILYENGFKDGRNEGQAIGKQEGYNEGIRDANEYSFLNLLGAVVDAPIQALSGLLNFDILGFNMLNFFLSLLTLALIIFVVRMFL